MIMELMSLVLIVDNLLLCVVCILMGLRRRRLFDGWLIKVNEGWVKKCVRMMLSGLKYFVSVLYDLK